MPCHVKSQRLCQRLNSTNLTSYFFVSVLKVTNELKYFHCFISNTYSIYIIRVIVFSIKSKYLLIRFVLYYWECQATQNFLITQLDTNVRLMRFYRKIDFQNFMGDDRHSPNFDFVMIYVYLPLFVCNMSKVRFVCSVQSPKYTYVNTMHVPLVYNWTVYFLR